MLTQNLLAQLKRRYPMSPLMLMLLLSLVPFPVLAVAILAERWLKATQKATS
jgi:nitrate reductase NapE component